MTGVPRSLQAPFTSRLTGLLAATKDLPRLQILPRRPAELLALLHLQDHLLPVERLPADHQDDLDLVLAFGDLGVSRYFERGQSFGAGGVRRLASHAGR